MQSRLRRGQVTDVRNMMTHHTLTFQSDNDDDRK